MNLLGLWLAPDFFFSATMSLTFMDLTEISQQLLDGLPWKLVQILRRWRECFSWSPDFVSCATMRFKFLALSGVLQQTLAVMSWNLVHTYAFSWELIELTSDQSYGMLCFIFTDNYVDIPCKNSIKTCFKMICCLLYSSNKHDIM